MLTQLGRSLRELGPPSSPVTPTIAILALVALAFAACIDGGRASGPLPASFLGDPDGVVPTGDASDIGDVTTGDVADVAADVGTDADAAAPDVLSDADAGPPLGDIADADTEGGLPDADGGEVEETCEPGLPGCPGTCTVNADCAELDDGNLCNGSWVCSAASVCVEAADAVVCGTGDDTACLAATCDPLSGGCVLRPRPEGVACEDGDDCTMADHCAAGVCVGGPRLHCDDGNPCTKDQCVPGGCSFPAAPGQVVCDDGNPCTADDSCVGGICKGNVSVCECQGDADCAEYEDGNACNGTVKCVNGKCNVPFATIVAATCTPAALGGCKVTRCNPASGQCEQFNVPNGAGCDDGDACTYDDQCGAGTCGGNQISCSGDDCLAGACDPATGQCDVAPAADGEVCGDGSTCLAGATCSAGVCTPEASACACAETADCLAFEDDDACNGTLKCVAGRCVVDAATIVTCVSDKEQCRQATCEPSTGKCTVSDTENGSSCDDGLPCTVDDFCNNGFCIGNPAQCSGASDCLVAACHPFAGCQQTPVAGACVSVDPCVATSACNGGDCLATTAVVCVSSGPCFDAMCDAAEGGCVDVANAATCDDGDDCTLGDVCALGFCAGEPLLCDDGNVCTADACEGGLCDAEPIDGLICDDGNSCTYADVCLGGACVGGGIPGCGGCGSDADCLEYADEDPCNGTLRCALVGACEQDPGSFVSCVDAEVGPCQVAACDPATGGCAVTDRADGLACASDDPCMSDGYCLGGACVGPPLSCDDGNPCTGDTCSPTQGCVHGPVGGPCDDGNPCTTGTACTAGQCLGGSNSCECVSNGQCNSQNDADKCNGTLKCANGHCVVNPTTVVLCPPTTNPCAVAACNPVSGLCGETPLEDGIGCSDGDPCTQGDVCQGGQCTAGVAVDCDDGNSCTQDACDPATGGCAYTANSAACDDGNPCTLTDSCQGGQCRGEPNACSCTSDASCDDQPKLADKCLGTSVCGTFGCELLPGSAVDCGQEDDTPCSFTACNPADGTCVDVDLPEGAGCDHLDKCIVGSTCDAEGLCTGGDGRVCDDGNPCTEDTCDPAVGCVFTPASDGTTCDDHDFCTIGEACAAGACTGGFNQCGCTSDVQCADKQPTDKCQGQYSCTQTAQGKKCVLGQPTVCAPTGNEPCSTNTCNPLTGQCKSGGAANGTSCDDGDPCTVGDACVDFLKQCVGEAKSCNDGDPCTLDSCDPFTGECTSDAEAADGISCVIGDPCVKNAKCSAGECTGTDFCNCSTNAQCNFLDDGDPCTGVFKCVDNYCQFDEASVIVCVDANPFDCIDNVCSPALAKCQQVPRAEGTPCDDALGLCTANDACAAGGACVGQVVVTCTDPTPNDCSDFKCIPTLGVCGDIQRADSLACSDKNTCTTNDKCVQGACQGALAVCDDGTPCTLDFCSATLGCQHVEIYGPCDDGDPCTEGSHCQDGECLTGTDICGCSEQEDCAFLDDGDLCTGQWDCLSNHCAIFPGTPIDCEIEVGPGQSEQCLVVSCDPETGACSTDAVLDDTGCDDGDPCTTADRCLGGACVAGHAKCDDGNPCTTDTCTPAGLCTTAAAANGAACDDGDTCNGSDACQSGVCKPGKQALCPCAEDGDCPVAEAGALCGASSTCVAGQCVLNPVSATTCPLDPTGCRTHTCDDDTGECVETLAPSGTSCNDADPCTVDDRCSFGECSGVPTDCTDDDPCTNDVCDVVLGCVHNAFSGPCDDGDPCTSNDSCLATGNCVGTPTDCDDSNNCTKDSCLAGLGCRHLPEPPTKPCNDHNPCSNNDRCNGSGGCAGTDLICICAQEEQCDDANGGDLCVGEFSCVVGFCILDKSTVPKCAESTDCLAVSCDPVTGTCAEEAINEGGACNDADACTTGDTCSAGECVGTPVTCVDSQPLNPCVETQCFAHGGCLDVEVTASSCSDSSLCTVADHCVQGECVGSPVPQPADSFAGPELGQDWAVESTGQEVAWQLTGAQSVSAPYALHLVNAAKGTLSDSGGAYSARAVWTVTVPFGPLGISLNFKLWAAYQAEGCANQTFSVTVDDASLSYSLRQVGTDYLPADPCQSTFGWRDARLFLPASAAGKTIEIAFNLDVTAADTQAGAGVFIDDVGLDWNCSN